MNCCLHVRNSVSRGKERSLGISVSFPANSSKLLRVVVRGGIERAFVISSLLDLSPGISALGFFNRGKRQFDN